VAAPRRPQRHPPTLTPQRHRPTLAPQRRPQRHPPTSTDPVGRRVLPRLDGAVVTAFQAAAVAAAGLPAPVARRVGEGVAVAAAYVPLLAGRRRVVRENLRQVYGPGVSGRRLHRLVDEAFASYGRYWSESLRLPSLTDAQVKAGMAFAGWDFVDDALSGGRGAILALPHLGGWEWAGRWLAITDRPVTVVVEELRPPPLFQWFLSYRRRLGMEVVPVGPGAGAAALAALRDNRVLCLLCDRVVGGTSGVGVQMFGREVAIPAGPVTLALRTGAPVMPTAVYFGSGADDHLAVIRPPLSLIRTGRLRDDVAGGTRMLAAEMEALIRRAPTQWHLMQPNWPGPA
jgi:lauroyl/myristoyl acyltransferase